jgi:hypothetical protein
VSAASDGQQARPKPTPFLKEPLAARQGLSGSSFLGHEEVDSKIG